MSAVEAIHQDHNGEENTVVPLVGFRMPLHKIDGANTAERFDKLHSAIENGKGGEFWGIREPDILTGFISNRPDNLKYRLMTLKSLLRLAPILEDEHYDALEKNYYDIEKSVNRLKSLSIKFGPGKIALNDEIDITYQDAYHDPVIRHNAIKALQEIGDPIPEIVRSMEVWRTSEKSDMEEAKKELGRSAFELFMFGYGENTLLPALQAATVAKYAE